MSSYQTSRRRRALALLILIVSAMLVVGRTPASPGESRRADCRTQGMTVGASRTVRLYRVRRGDADIFYYACGTTQRRRTSIGHFNSTSCGVRPLALRGDYVAAFDNSCLRPTNGIITVHNIPARRSWRIQEGVVALTGLEISAAGTAVWIRRGSDCTEPDPRCAPRVEVRTAERGGAVRTLDTGDIDPASLGLTNQTLEPVSDWQGPVRAVWLSGGQPRSAVIR